MAKPPRSLGESAFRGAAVTGFGQLARILLQVLSIIVLARLLSPEDYGLLAMVTVVIGVGELFRDFGLSSAAIQSKTLSNAQRSNLFWLNSVIGVVLSLICFAAAPLLSVLYGDARLTLITQLLATTFLINGVATQFRADLNRSLKFGTLSVIDVVSQFVGLAVGVGAALLGAEYWSLVAMQVTIALVSATGSAVSTRWMPRWYNRQADIRPFFRFGISLLGSQLVNYAGKNADSFVIGLALGPVQLGFYNRAFQLLLLPLNQLQAPSTRVALPILSRLQDDKPRFDAFILQGQTALLHVVAVVLAFTASQATVLFSFVLGDQWVSAAPLFQALAIGGLASMANYACYWVFLSKGLTSSYLVFSLITRPFLIGSVVVGSMFGALGVAIAYSAASFLLWPCTLLWLRRVSNAPVGRMFRVGIRTVVVYAVAGGAAFAVGLLVANLHPLFVLSISLLAFVAAVAVCAVIVPSFRRDLASLAALRVFMGGRKK
ncbi:lipopolysaccharide biosynthesis protein [Agromyces atrinae]|uniref:Lipopolysaccharide biosynthesis protein n=1 Tax=Agromyces atrinae TaxID=592376 RepID=A0A4Q2M3W0_9MICO|nr:lipopolysaccharide biosynthesis protein [Agromyces atrinae]NYD68511.1 PST family polysaccharide transporter [Agromyces atrinae]RXZ85897.1 lipopolysaccharide biosynthesis protein [Agromyces atrinae]